MILFHFLQKCIINLSRFEVKVSSFWHVRQNFSPFFLQSDSYLRLVFLLTSSVALTTLSVRTFSPSVTVTIGEFTRVPDLWAMSALALGIDCPSSGLPSNARMRTDLQRHERWRRKARHKCGAAYCREKHPK